MPTPLIKFTPFTYRNRMSNQIHASSGQSAMKSRFRLHNQCASVSRGTGRSGKPYTNTVPMRTPTRSHATGVDGADRRAAIWRDAMLCQVQIRQGDLTELVLTREGDGFYEVELPCEASCTRIVSPFHWNWNRFFY